MAGRVDVSRWYIPRTSPAPAGDASAATTATDPMEDLRVITSTLSMNPYVSRLRADLPAIMLDRDLDLGASDRPDRPALYQYARQANVPPRPVCLGPGDAGFISNDVTVVVSMADAGPASLDGGVASDDAGSAPMAATAEGGASCAVGRPGAAGAGWRALLLGALAVVTLRRRRRA